MIRLPRESDYAFRPAAADPSRPESLLLALEAVLRAAGRAMDYEDLAGATGVGMLFAWAEDESCPGRNVAHGRDVALAASADLLGLMLRPMHPPPGPARRACPPTAGHFRDSYAPLLTIALAHGQPVLCQGGWTNDPGPPPLWGILTRTIDQPRQAGGESARCEPGAEERAGPAGPLPFAGWTVGAEGEPVPLACPPGQLFVVEMVLPESPSEGQLLCHGVRLAGSWPTSRPLAERGLLAGSAAMDRWAEALATCRPFCPTCNQDSWRCHLRLARHLSAGRIAAYEFLCRHGHDAARDIQAACMAVEPLLARQLELLAEMARPDRVEAEFSRPAGQVRLAAAVVELAELERQAEQVLAPACQGPA